jgi:[CysO sulfur-carrier protein]-S-L-cysteine hydrolase
VHSIRIRGDVLSTIESQAEREAPLECCGLLVGAADLIDEAVPAPNVLSSASRFQLDPRVHVETNRRLRGTARQVLGTYHSHPRSAAVPSARDLAEAHYPEFVWLIVSLQSTAAKCRAYRIVGGNAEELTIVVE